MVITKSISHGVNLRVIVPIAELLSMVSISPVRYQVSVGLYMVQISFGPQVGHGVVLAPCQAGRR